MRLQTFYLLAIQLPEDTQIKTPQDLIRFEWEKSVDDKVKILVEPNWDELNMIWKNMRG